MRGTSKLLSLLLVASSSLSLGACKKQQTGPMPLCTAEVASGTAVESEAQELPAEVWFSILLRGFDSERMLPGEDLQDCSRTSALIPTPPPATINEDGTTKEIDDEPGTIAGCPIAADLETGRLPVRPLTDEDIVINEGPEGKTLVWVQAVHYENGEAIGPAAMVEWSKSGIAVRALGTLRTFTDKARMRIEYAGQTPVLVVESDNCSFDDKICQRVMKLLPLLNDRFSTVPLKTEDGTCIGEAAFPLFQQYTSDLPDGWVRKFEVNRSVSFDGEHPLVAEQVVVRDKDPNQPDAPPQDFREASNDRKLVYKDRYFETRPSLWQDMIDNYGSVAHDADAEDDE